MAPFINAGSREAVKAFVKQIRQTGVGKQVISQQLKCGAEITAYPSSKEGMLNIYHRVTNSSGATMTDVFNANLAKGKPKHVRSDICSAEGGSLFFWPGKKGFLGLFGSKQSRVIVDNKDSIGRCTSEFVADLNGSATKAKSILHKTGKDGESLIEHAIATVGELKEAIRAILENRPL